LKLHLVRLSKKQGEARFPALPGFRSYLLSQPETHQEARLYILLEGEAVIDLAEGYLHLRPGEGAHVEGGHTLTPIDPSVIAVWQLAAFPTPPVN
jgi:hypothetical protein